MKEPLKKTIRPTLTRMRVVRLSDNVDTRIDELFLGPL
jgi:hypothetical protein